MSDLLKQKCAALGDALYEVLKALQGDETAESATETKKRGRPAKTKSEESEQAAAPAPAAPAPAAPAPAAPAPAAPAPAAPAPAAPAEDLDDLFSAPKAKKNAEDIKNLLMNWAMQDPDKRKPRAIGIFRDVSGFDSFKHLTDDNATDIFYKLEAALAKS